MDKKQKIMLIVIGIFIITAVVVWFYFHQKNINLQSDVSNDVSNETKTTKVEQYGPVFMNGEIVSFSDNQLEFKNGDYISKTKLNSGGAFIYTRENGSIDKRETVDLKDGTKVKVEFDMQKDVIMSIEILDNIGEVKKIIKII